MSGRDGSPKCCRNLCSVRGVILDSRSACAGKTIEQPVRGNGGSPYNGAILGQGYVVRGRLIGQYLHSEEFVFGKIGRGFKNAPTHIQTWTPSARAGPRWRTRKCSTPLDDATRKVFCRPDIESAAWAMSHGIDDKRHTWLLGAIVGPARCLGAAWPQIRLWGLENGLSGEAKCANGVADVSKHQYLRQPDPDGYRLECLSLGA